MRILLVSLALIVAAPALSNIGNGAIRHGIVGSGADPNGVRGGGKVGGGKGLRGPPAGKGPPGGGLPEEASITYWYDSEDRNGDDTPKNIGSGSFATMTKVGTDPINVVTDTVGTTANVDVWEQGGGAISDAYFESDDGLAGSSPRLIDTGEDGTYVWLINPGGLGSGSEEIGADQRISGTTPQQVFAALRGGFNPYTWDFTYDGVSGGAQFTGQSAADLDVWIVCIVIINDANDTEASGGDRTWHIRKLKSGSSWVDGSTTAGSQTIRSNHRMFYPGDNFLGYIHTMLLYDNVALTADQRDEVYQYFVDRFGEEA